MPYNKLSELPKNVTNNLPKHAQEIYRAAFNHALETYKDSEKRKGNDSLEEVAHKVAWSAVEQKYTKKDGHWQEK